MHEDEKKVNLIKCPLPKIIYMSIKGLTSFSKKPEKSSNSTIYFTKKLTHQQPNLPSLKMSSKLSFSPNKTNYTRDIQSKKLNNLDVKKSMNLNINQINIDDNNKIDNHKIMNKKQSMKEILNSYGLNRYYEKFIQSGINDKNFNQIGYMNKKMLNDFINILNIFPSHIIKMEQLYIHLKKMNNDNNIQNQLNNINNNGSNNIRINNSAKNISNSSNFNNCHIEINNNSSINNNNSHNNNNVNYVTLTFSRNNLNNLKTRVSHSQNKSKYRYVNIKIKQKRVNSNRLSSEKNKSKKDYITNYSQKPNLGNKNKSKTKLITDNIMSQYNFAPPKPNNLGRNDLIKFFFKDLENMNTNNNTTGINNLTHFNIFKNNNNKKNNNFSKTNNSSLTGSVKELNKDKKDKNNTYFTKYREKHSAPNNNNIQESNHTDLPKIKSMHNKNIKINTQYSKALLSYMNMNEGSNGNSNINIKTSYNKLNKNMKNNNDKKIDSSKVISTYQVDFSIKTFFNNKEIKNINKNNNNIGDNNTTNKNRKNSLRRNINNNSNNNNINSTYVSHRTHLDINRKNVINYGIKLKLPNVIKKIGVQNAAQKNKHRNKDIKDLKVYKEGNKNVYLSSSHISLINEKSNNNKLDNNYSSKSKDELVPEINKMNQVEKADNNYSIKDKKFNNEKTNILSNTEENKKDKTNININIEEKKKIPLENKNNIVQDKKIFDNEIIRESGNNLPKNEIKKDITNNDKNMDNNNGTTMLEKQKEKEKENIIKPVKEKIENNGNNEINENLDNLENIIYENLRLNHSFSENNKENIFQFDAEFLGRCLGLCLSILIETSKESPHITEINLEALSASEIKYFFFNELYNDNMNLLFDVFDKEVNTNINMEQISPLDKLDIILSQNNKEQINYDISYLKHIKKEKDEQLIKAEEEKEKEIENKENNENKKINNVKVNSNMLGIGNREGFKIRTGAGDIERDIKMIDEFFSMNNRKKKKAKNYNFISDMSKNILCKELSYINEIDSELNGTNSNINNTNIGNNSNSNNNINEKNMKEENTSNFMDNEDIKEIQKNNEEENNNTFNNEINELGIITENNDDNDHKNKNSPNNTLKNISNNSINIKEDEGSDIPENKKELDVNIINNNEDNKIISLTNNEENNISNNNNNEKENNLNNAPLKININNNEHEIDDKNQLNNNITLEKKENENNPNIIPNSQKSFEESQIQIIKEEGEENIYESDYILDIVSIEELTYYLIKRSEIFDEDFNYMYMKIIERRYIPTPEPQTIFDFMADIIILTKMEKEVIVLSLIYIERLIFNTGLLLTSRNWRRILLTAMIISSKVWDDSSFENDHFSQVFANLGVNEINTLERIFLELINYKVYVKQSEYFKYLMLIKIIAMKYSYNGREIVKASIIKNLKFKEFNETMQNRMRKKVTLNNSAQF